MSRALSDKFIELEDELAELENSDGEFAPHRRAVLNNALADMLYALSETLKGQGKTDEANKCHSLANEHWSKVVAEVADLNKSKND